MSIEQKVWNYFIEKNFTPQGIAGIMGNLYKESRFKTNNLQDTYNQNFGMTDEQYTAGVDNNTYNLFINDGAGYGLAQWTWSGLKKDLYLLCKSRKKSISDLDCQLDQLYLHLQSEGIFNEIKNATSINQATEIFMKKFEKPKDQSDAALNERIGYSKKYYTQFNNNFKGGNNQMKYSLSNPPINCMMMDSTCYQQTNKMAVKGVLWHSTGANNKTIKRYVQPSDKNGVKKDELLALIGKNMNGNDWNHIYVQAGVNAWIGTLADGTVAAVQTLPWDFKPWGCGSGSRGSCNNGWIQFEICEDSLVDGNYFLKVYQEACELTAYLCSFYGIDPHGTVQMNGISVPTILCHQDSYQLGLGTNHSDVYHWFNRYGKTMANVRDDVAKLMGQNSSPTPKPTPTPVPTPTPSSNIFLRKGSKDTEKVKQLQENLIKLGYNLGAWGADGDFGSATYNAVIAFQQKNNLLVDGIVGNDTWNAIQNAIKNLVPVDEIYRVRKSWLDPKSQIGAYKNLNNAKAVVDKLGQDYHVYNSKGQEVYPIVSNNEVNQTSKSSVAIALPVATKYDNVVLASASKDERGQYVGGQKGDQTKKEVYILNWYKQGWNYVLRPKTQVLAENIARAAEAGCANDNIGYNQAARNTLYTEALKVGLDLSKINTPCDCDCSSFVSICCICAGLSASIFYQGNNMRTTYTMKDACEQTGQFITLTGNKYTDSGNYLKRGDILLNSRQHVVIVLQDGPNAETAQAQNNNNFKSYRAQVIPVLLNIHAGASLDSKVVGQVSKNQVYTIVDEKGGFGKLKSGAGWISLEYVKKM